MFLAKSIELLLKLTNLAADLEAKSQLQTVQCFFFRWRFALISGQVPHSWSPKSGEEPPDFWGTRVTRVLSVKKSRGCAADFWGISPGWALPKSGARFLISGENPLISGEKKHWKKGRLLSNGAQGDAASAAAWATLRA